MIHFIHRIDKKNIGDLSCCPLQYFKLLKMYPFIDHDVYCVDFLRIQKNDIVILGGGGLFDCLDEWNKTINKILDLCDTVITWGVGFNKHRETQIQVKINFSKFKILNIRDFNHILGFDFLPCSSCMIKSLSKTYPIKREIGIVAHKDFPVYLGFDKIDNKCSLKDVIHLLGRALLF